MAGMWSTRCTVARRINFYRHQFENKDAEPVDQQRIVSDLFSTSATETYESYPD